MELYVIRHAIAEVRDPRRWPDDSQRPLTARGRRRFRPVTDLLGHMAPQVDVLLSSRYVRAWETAELLVEWADWPRPIGCPALEFDSARAVTDLIARDHGAATTIALVGHEPCQSELISHFVTGSASGLNLEMKKGAAACISFEDTPARGTGTLAWVLTPRLARARRQS